MAAPATDIASKRPNIAKLILAALLLCQASVSRAADAQTDSRAHGLRLFEQHCAVCHAARGEQQRAPDLPALQALASEDILNALTLGSMSGMARNLSDAQKRDIAQSIGAHAQGSGVSGDADAMSNRCSRRQSLPRPTLKANWQGWGAGVANTRFQSARNAGLTVEQAPRLTLKWAFGFPHGIAFGQPTIASGRLFIGSSNGYVYALDAATGCVFWSFRAGPGIHTAISVGPLKHKSPSGEAVYFGDMKAQVYALDAASGRLLWKTRVDDHPLAHITGSPQLYRNALYVPVSSAEEGRASDPRYPCCTFRGSVVRLDAGSGKPVWKTYTIPNPPVPLVKNTLGTQLWGPAGAAVWNAPTIDPKRHALYVGTGDSYTLPAADRSDSILALDLKSGRVLWSVQDTTGDAWIFGCKSSVLENCPKPLGPDYDIGASPILQSLPDGRQLIVAAQKSGDVVAHDPDRQGAVVWKTNLAEAPPPGEGEGIIVFGGAADDQSAYFPLTTGGATAVRLSNGARRWATRFPATGADALGQQRPYGQTAAGTAIPGVFFTGGWDGVLRALSTADGAVIWQYDTVSPYDTVNGVPGTGGSMGAPGPAVAGGMVFVGSGYLANPGPGKAHPGNVLLAFGAD